MRCLIADDVTILRRIIENIVKPYFEAVLAENGQMAYDLFEEAVKNSKPFTVVFLDILMPRLNGLQALQKMRQCEIKYHVKNKAKIIMITGLSDQHSVKLAVQEGCNGYILKPYTPLNVMNALKKQGIDVEKMTPLQKNKQQEKNEKVKEEAKSKQKSDKKNNQQENNEVEIPKVEKSTEE